MARRPAPDTRERILDTATRLFDAYGVRAVGLQQIIDELGCGKNLLYREFATKDELVVAYLWRRGEEWTSIVDHATRPLADDPAGQLVAIVQALADRATVPGFRGCPVHNTHAEFPDANHPAHKVAIEQFDASHAQLYEFAKRTGAADPQALADRLMLIIDGLGANGAAQGPRGAARAAVAFAEEVVHNAVRPQSASSGVRRLRRRSATGSG